MLLKRLDRGERTPRASGKRDYSRTDLPRGSSTEASSRVTRGALEEAREIVWRHRKRLALGLSVLLIGRLAGLVLPATSKFLIDDVIGRGNWDLLPMLAVGVGAATIVQAVASFSLSQILGVAAQRAITDMRRDILSHILRLPVREFDSTRTGVLISRIMADPDGIRNLVGNGLVQLAGSLLTALLALAVLAYLNWKLTVVMVLMLAVFGAGLASAFRRLRPMFRERGAINAEVTGRLAEALGGIRVVKAYTAEHHEELIFARGVHRHLRNIAKSLSGVSAVGMFTTLLLGAGGIAIMLIGGASIRAGSMTVGDFVMYLAFTGLVSVPVTQLAGTSTQISDALAGLDRIREIRRLATEGDGDAGRLQLPNVRGDIEFDNVTFEYTPGVPVLKEVSLVAPVGSTTALVGSSGSGKSTLISLVMAFNHPVTGTVKIDGHDLKTVQLKAYRKQLGVVLQDNFLFDGTIAENIAYARPQATRDEIVEVSRIAHCDEFVTAFEQGYDTIVGERGIRLSGGQRQRVAIARAILADPRILVLDEATSSLDSESEMLIQDGLRALRRGRTTFVIAHRLSTIRSADQILVLEHGEIVERGTHEGLLLQNGRYRQLYDKQYHFERDRFINPGEDFTPEAEAAVSSEGGSPNEL